MKIDATLGFVKYTEQPYDHLPNNVLVPLLMPKKPLDHDVSSKLCKLCCIASMDRTCFTSTLDRCLIGLKSGGLGSQVNTTKSCFCSSNHS